METHVLRMHAITHAAMHVRKYVAMYVRMYVCNGMSHMYCMH